MRARAPRPAQEQAEVEAGGGEHGVDAVAISAFEIVAPHPMIILEMADHGLDGGATAHLATDGLGDPADLAADPDLEPVRIVVAAIALVAMDRRTAAPVSFSRSAMTGPSVWPSYGLPCSALACSTNCPPLGAVAGVAIDTLQPNS